MRNDERFIQFLQDKEIFFEEKKGPKGERLITARQQIDGAGVLCIVFSFDSFDSNESVLHMLILGIAKIESPMKREELLRLVNDLNRSYGFIKYLVSDNGDVTISYDVSVTNSFNYEQIIEILRFVVTTLEERDMKKFMRLQWA